METESSKLRNWINPGAITGLMIMATGVILLLDRTGLVNARDLFRFWPVALVAIGLVKMSQSSTLSDRIWAGLLVTFGVILLLGAVGYVHVHFWDLWPLALIGFGLTMIFGAGSGRGSGTGSSISRLNESAVFGGGERRITVSDFEGGQISALFGGFKIDLTQAGMKEKEATIDVNAIFGGCEIRVPQNWNVIMRGTGIFGGYSDQTHHPPSNADANNLIVRGVAMFGGVEVKN